MEQEKNIPDALPVPEQGAATYQGIHQLYKDIPELSENHQHIFPVTYTQSVYDGKTGANLEHILHQFNHVFLQFQGTPEATRCLLPKDMRRKGIMISYRDMDDIAITERNIDESESTSDNWGLNKYWERYEGINVGELEEYIKNLIDKINKEIQDTINNANQSIDELIQNINKLIQQTIEEIKAEIGESAGDIISNIVQEYLEGDEFKEYVNTKIEEIAGGSAGWQPPTSGDGSKFLDDSGNYDTIKIKDVEGLTTTGSGNNWLTDNGIYTNPFPIVSEEEVLTILPNQIVTSKPVQIMVDFTEESSLLTAETLNANYPDVPIGYTVNQYLFGKIFQKVTNTGQWISYDVTLVE